MAKELTLGAMFSSFGDVVGRNFKLFGIVAAVQAVVLALNETFVPSGARTGLSLVVSIFIGYHVLEAVLEQEGLLHDTGSGRRYGSYIGASILSGLGMILGMLLLILPGVLLMARWSVALPFIIGEGCTATEGMSKSWEATRGSTWSILAMYLIFGVLFLVVIGVIGFGAFTAARGGEEPGFLFNLGTNFASGLIGMGSTALSVAIYHLISGPRERLSDIFA
ncbi:MAG: glycerophosphoryl diester phosphodiesterase membrane domain-containing protein [Sphingomonadales bacterium]|nr:glycerophosphoryl diester phosphodiesterase membrane domain-containing protein [Sphingomonadales bacterium]